MFEIEVLWRQIRYAGKESHVEGDSMEDPGWPHPEDNGVRKPILDCHATYKIVCS
jgi:hypothetical protein